MPYVDKTLTLTAADLAVGSARCIVSNGIVRMHMSREGVGAADVRVFGLPSFDFGDVRVFGGDSTLLGQSMHLQNGLWQCETMSATNELLSLRHMPNGVLQRFQAKAGAATVVHTVAPPIGAVADRFDHVLLNIQGLRVPCLVVEARTAQGRAAYACAYLNAGVEFDGAERRDGVVRNRCQVGTDGVLDILHCVIHGESDVVNQLTKDVLTKAVQLSGTAAKMRTLHTMRWNALWKAQARVVPRDTTDQDVAALNRALEQSVFRILCAVPDEIVLGESGADVLEGDAELLVAALLPLHAEMPTRALSRFTWDAYTPLSVLTRFIVDVWAAFRATLDAVWLRGIIGKLQAALDEVVTRVQVAGLDVETSTYTIDGVGPTTGRDGAPLEDDAYNTILVKHAIEAGTQASYETHVYPRDEWVRVDRLLAMPVNDAREIIPVTDTGTAAVEPEHALLLHPFYYRQTLGIEVDVLTANMPEVVVLATSMDYVLRVSGLAVEATAAAYMVTSAERRVALDALAARYYVLAEPMLADWGALGDGVPTGDVAAFFAAFVYGFARTRLTGQVSPTSIHIETAALTTPRHATLPYAWRAILRSSASVTSPLQTLLNTLGDLAFPQTP
jgi:hypothetical protein